MPGRQTSCDLCNSEEIISPEHESDFTRAVKMINQKQYSNCEVKGTNYTHKIIPSYVFS